MLNTDSFKKAINSYKEIIERYDIEKDDNAIRDALIQRFEYTYDLSIKMIKRYLKDLSSLSINVNSLTFNELIREALQAELLKGNLEDWIEYRNKRNLTPHTYDEKKADEVVLSSKKFLNEVLYLLKRLECLK